MELVTQESENQKAKTEVENSKIGSAQAEAQESISQHSEMSSELKSELDSVIDEHYSKSNLDTIIEPIVDTLGQKIAEIDESVNTQKILLCFSLSAFEQLKRIFRNIQWNGSNFYYFLQAYDLLVEQAERDDDNNSYDVVVQGQDMDFILSQINSYTGQGIKDAKKFFAAYSPIAQGYRFYRKLINLGNKTKTELQNETLEYISEAIDDEQDDADWSGFKKSLKSILSPDNEEDEE